MSDSINMKFRVKLKVIILSVLVQFFPSVCFSDSFELEGEILNVPDTCYVKVVYDALSDGNWKRISHDSILVKDGAFSLSGQTGELSPAYIVINKQHLRFYIEPTKIKLQVDAYKPYNIKLSGTSIDDEFRTYVSDFYMCDSVLAMKFQEAVNWEYDSEYSLDAPGMYSLLVHKKEKKLLDFCKKHLRYKILPDLLLQVLEIDMDPWNAYYDVKKHTMKEVSKRDVFSGINEIDKVINKLPAERFATSMGKILLNNASHAKTVYNCRKKPIGAEAPTFAAVTSTGDTVDIIKFRNKKYVLLYFWADKIEETANAKKLVKEMTEHIPSNDIVRISISSVLVGEEWKKEIAKRTSDYFHVEECFSSDLYQLFVNHIGSMYPISTLPAYVLINKEGKISRICPLRISGDAVLDDHN